MVLGFIHEGEKIPIEDMEKLPYPKSFLRAISEEREWTGTPSVTQLTNGLMQIYLEKDLDRWIIPEDETYKIMGTATHAKLERNYDDSISEFNFQFGWITGTTDVIEIDESGQIDVWDYKNTGTYGILKFLGMDKLDVPSLDANGEKQYYGPKAKKAGELKTHKKWVQTYSPKLVDTWSYTFQVNMYAHMTYKVLGALHEAIFNNGSDVWVAKVIHKNGDKSSKLIEFAKRWNGKFPRMHILFIARDGGMKSAVNHGQDKRLYSVSIPYNEPKLKQFLRNAKKHAENVVAVKDNGYVPTTGCTYLESKNGAKCEKFCPVRDICNHKFKGETHAG